MQSERPAKGLSRDSDAVVAPLAGTGWFGKVRGQLGRILASDRFQATDRSRQLLRFLVEETLAGRGDRLKQYAIATQLFGRDDDFDPNTDPVVRAEAAKLRRSLEHYYLTIGREDQMVIELPKGAYAVKVTHRDVDARETPHEPLAGDVDLPHHGPRIAVLPLHCMAEGRDAEIFTAGLTEELIIALARFEDIQVIGHHSVLGYGTGQSDVRVAAARLNLDFVLIGSVRWEAERLRTTAQLIDARTAVSIWAETYDRRLTARSAFAVQDDIVTHVSGRVGGHYGEIAKSMATATNRSRTNRLDAYEAVLRYQAYIFYRNFGPDFLSTRDALRKAVEIDLNYALAWAMLAELEVDDVALGFSDHPVGLDEALRMARRAVELEPECQQAHCALGYALMHRHDFDDAIRAFDRCIELHPNAADAAAISGSKIAVCGEWERGLEILRRGTRLNPNHPGWLHFAPLLDCWRRGDFVGAHEAAMRFNTPALAWDSLLRAATLTRLGRIDEARTAIAQLLRLDPAFGKRARAYIGAFVYDDALAQDMLSALHEAGLRLF